MAERLVFHPEQMKAKSETLRQTTIDLRVAETMRRLRNQQSLTLAALGEQCGLSAAYLSRVENHRAALTLHNLDLVARALKVPMTTFFEENEAALPMELCRAGSGRKQRFVERISVGLELLAAGKRGKLMEPILVTLNPEAVRQPLRSHAGEEFNYVLTGKCAFSYGQEEMLLSEGDAVYYDASVPHAMHTADGNRCVLMAVVASRDYLFHGDLEKLLKFACE